MKIDRIYIDGYGRAEATHILLAPGLTVLRGANGTGKTTIHQFLRAVLFGFVKDEYPLVRGGRRGGTIAGTADDGKRFEVTRYGDAVTGAGQKLSVRIDGVEAGDPDRALSSVIGGVTKHVFESVFAFGQDELRDMSRITKAEVSNRIYGASIGVVADVLRVEAGLSAELDSLWKSRGSIPATNQRLSRIETLQREARSRDLPAEYSGLRLDLDRLGLERSRADEELAACEGRARTLESLLTAFGPWGKVREFERQLAALPEEPAVTASDLARQAELSKAVTLAGEQAARARLAREQLDAALVEARFRDDVIQRAAEIDHSVAAASQWQARERDLEERRRGAEGLRRTIDATLAEAGWDEPLLSSADLGHLRRRVAEQATACLDTPARGVAGPAERARAESAHVARLRAQIERLDRELEALEDVDPGRVEAIEAGAATIATDLGRSDVLQRHMEAAPAPETASRRVSVPMVIPVAGGVVLVTGLVIAFVGPAILAVLLACAGVALLGVRVALLRRTETPAPPAEHPSAAELRGLEARIEAQWSALGLAESLRDAGLERLGTEVRRLRSLVDARGRIVSDRTRYSAELNEREMAAVAARSAEQNANAAIAAGLDQWKAFMGELRFPPLLDRDAAVALITKLELARSQADEMRELEAGIAKTAKERRTWEEGALRLSEEIGVQPDEDAVVVVERMRQELANARMALRAREDLARRRDAEGAVERAADRRVTESSTEHAVFMEAHGVSDGLSLQARHERTRQRRTMEAGLQQAREALAGLIESERRDEIDGALAMFDQPAAETQLAAIREEADARRDHRDGLITGLAQCREQLRRLEQEADTSAARQALADELGALTVDATRWLELRIALELLRATRGHYEAKHRPAVLARAEALFLDWTAGEYSGFDRLSGTGLEAVISARDGKRVPLVGLSRGTSEQLYLAMRIALVEHLATQQESLPIMMDDVLVNFDPERGGRVARSIEELARRRQVLYLTCHSDVRLGPQRTIELGDDVNVLSTEDAMPDLLPAA